MVAVIMLNQMGEMAKEDKWVDGGRYYVGYNGVWQSKPADGNPYSAALKKQKL